MSAAQHNNKSVLNQKKIKTIGLDSLGKCKRSRKSSEQSLPHQVRKIGPAELIGVFSRMLRVSRISRVPSRASPKLWRFQRKEYILALIKVAAVGLGFENAGFLRRLVQVAPGIVWHRQESIVFTGPSKGGRSIC
jgi:hypothetical protein